MLSRELLIYRGKCCGNNCSNCPYIPKYEVNSTKIDDFFCDNCENSDLNELYNGWFYTNQKLNEFAQGTASSNIMINRIVCKKCANLMIELNLSNIKEKIK